MGNQIDSKARTLAQILAANRLTKVAADQEIKHETPLDQNNLGAEQTKEIKDNVDGTIASAPAAANKDKEPETPPNCQDLNKSPEAALSSTGTSVKVEDGDGNAAALPKSAAEYKHQLAVIMKTASMRKQAAYAAAKEFRTGRQVMEKLASLNEKSTQGEIDEFQGELMKLASTNPMFQVVRDRILMTKLAAEVEELAAAQGISPEEAAANLDAAAEANPDMLADASAEADAEAVGELADAEDATDDLMAGVEALAANASHNLGVEVTSEDILDAVDEVEAQAEQMGVPPEALIQAAVEQMTAEANVTDEDEAAAQAIMEEAAAQGISPDEVIQGALADAEGAADEGVAAAAAESAPAAATESAPAAATESAPAAAAEGEGDGGKKEDEDEGEKKEAAVKKTANLSSNPRVAFVQHLMNQKTTKK